MAQNFYQDDNFEEFLRSGTEDFKMYPSRKVWYSLYNNLHPAKKWPSFAVTLCMLSVMLYFGVTNNNRIHHETSPYLTLSSISTDEALSTAPAYTFGKQVGRKNIAPAVGSTANIAAVSSSTNQDVSINVEDAFSSLTESALQQTGRTENAPGAKQNLYTSNPTFTATKTKTSENTGFTSNEINTTDGHDLNVEIASATLPVPSALPAILLQNDEKAWIENYAFENKKTTSALKQRGSLSYYLTPSVGFRWLVKKYDGNVYAASNAPAIVNQTTAPVVSQNINDQITQKSALNLEFGAALVYQLGKYVRLKAGVQVNYTNYIVRANSLNHSSVTELDVYRKQTKTVSQVQKVSFYANSIDNNSNLNNSTFQIGIPVGADLKLAGTGKLKWYAGATLQPTYLTGGEGVVISADEKNYIMAPDLLRKFNVNAALETFVSYNTGQGISINIGPQVRYQLLSNYKSSYNYSEKLYNAGVKVGITKSLK